MTMSRFADQLSPAPPPPTKERLATWTFTAAATGSHDIYVKWVPLVGRATDSTYTVNHDGGATPVIVDQSAGEGFWTLLGSYNLTASQAYTLDLSDQGNGSVSADAIYVVETPAPEPPGPPDAVSWTPDLPAPGNYEVFVKYQADASRASAVYTIVHAGGNTDVPLDQTQNGGIWVSLGSFDFDAGTTGSVSVPASTAGTISADAVRFLTESAPAGDTVYILSDHLGTPQKLVDQDRLVVWDRVQTPFGITHFETAAPVRATNVRFPGQRADTESGLSYNYFRDYDPSTGRYIQSDPIGLAGGLNTYGYVGGNPLSFGDPFGLSQEDIDNMLKLAKKLEPDLPIPSKVKVKDLGHNMLGKKIVGRFSRWTRKIYVDTIYWKPFLSCEELIDLYDTIVHESLHKDWPWWKNFFQPRTTRMQEPAVIYEATQRAQKARPEIEKKCKCE